MVALDHASHRPSAAYAGRIMFLWYTNQSPRATQTLLTHISHGMILYRFASSRTRPAVAVAAAAAECEYNCGRGCDDMAVVVHGQSCTKSWLTASCVISRVTYRLPCMDEMHGWSAQ